MNPQRLSLGGLCLGLVAVLGTQVLSYGLVYPSARLGQRSPVWWALLAGAGLGALAVALSVRGLRGSRAPSHHFAALLSLALACFFLFVLVFGFGIPTLFLDPRD